MLEMMAPMLDETPDAAVRLGLALMENTHLRRLNVTISHHWTIQGAQTLATGIRNSRIRSLWVTLRNDSNHLWCPFFQGLFPSRNIQQITIVSTPEHSLQQLVGDLISSLKASLRQFSIFRAKCDVPRLAEGLRNASKLLTRLDIRETNLRDDDGNCMRLLSIGCCSYNSIVTFVTLDSTEIDDVGIAAWIQHWHPTSGLRALTLRHNKIGTVGVQLLLRATTSHPNLKYLQLDDNKNIGYAGLEMIGDELPNLARTFKRLFVSRCVDQHDDKNTIRRERSARDALLYGIQENVYLQELGVSDNFLAVIHDNTHINFYVQLNQLGRYILQTNHREQAPSIVWCHVLAKCQHNTSAMYYFLQELPHLIGQRTK